MEEECVVRSGEPVPPGAASFRRRESRPAHSGTPDWSGAPGGGQELPLRSEEYTSAPSVHAGIPLEPNPRTVQVAASVGAGAQAGS